MQLLEKMTKEMVRGWNPHPPPDILDPPLILFKNNMFALGDEYAVSCLLIYWREIIASVINKLGRTNKGYTVNEEDDYCKSDVVNVKQESRRLCALL